MTGRTLSYQWQKSLDNISYSDIPTNANSMNYQPGTVTQTTYFRRVTNAVGGSCIPHPSSFHKIDVIDLDAGEFDPAHSKTICVSTLTNNLVVHGTLNLNKFLQRSDGDGNHIGINCIALRVCNVCYFHPVSGGLLWYPCFRQIIIKTKALHSYEEPK